MDRELSSDEKSFVEETLSSHRNLDLEVDEETNTVKVVKTSQAKVPGYKNPFRWFIAIASLPVLLVGAFFVLLIRAENYLGGKQTLQYLVENNYGETGEMIAQVAENAGQGWLPEFLVIYEYRMPIIVAVVVIFLAILLTYTLVDNWRYKKKQEKESKFEKTDETVKTEESNLTNIDTGENTDG